MPRRESVTQTAFAASLGVTQPYISQLAAKGIVRLTKAGRVADPIAARAAIEAARDPSKEYTRERHAAKRKTNGNAHKDSGEAQQSLALARVPSKFQQARTTRETYVSLKAKLDYEMRIGKLVRVDEFVAAYADKLASTRDELRAIPDRCAARVAATKDVAECWKIIDGEIKSAMRHLIADQKATV